MTTLQHPLRRMLDDFFTRALLAGVGLAFATGPLGCFVVWRRMAYFGDATAHAAILGVALALWFSVPIMPAVVVVALAVALAIVSLTGRNVAADTLMGVIAHGALALGLVALALQQNVRVDLIGYLFGDILSVGRRDLAVIWGGGAVVLILIGWRWSALVTATVNPELAFASGIEPKREELVLTLALAITVAMALKVVGAVLIAAMLIIPAAAARPLAATPERMAALAVTFGALSALAGLAGSYVWDTPAGPSIVTAAVVLFVVTQLAAGIRGTG